ncbi:MAG: CoA transferase [Caldilineaceae bacterium]|nr:CoA transferase [Caldilineaceae bacterium]
MTAKQPMQGPLTGLKVVEITHIMAGPTCGLMLADMGADVIKVERLPRGDDTRRTIPPTIPPTGDGESAAFMMMNRNKRGIAIDFKQPAGIALLRRLILQADILVENLRTGALAHYGLGYATLKAEQPGLIYCSITGFGLTGPYAERGGFDLIAQGMSGLMSITGEMPTEENRNPAPVKVGAPMTDITAGILAAMGILAALYHRQQTGLGQQVDTSLFEAGITHTYWQSAICLATGVAPGPLGSAHPLMAPYQAFQTADGWINIGAANQANWEKLIKALDAAHLGEDPRFLTNAGRLTNLPALVKLLTPYFHQQTTAEWMAIFETIGLPAGPVLSVAEVHADPQTLAREMVVEVEHSRVGTVKTLGLPVKFSDTPGGVRHGAPILGEHTREILAEAGYEAEEINHLLAERVVASPG